MTIYTDNFKIINEYTKIILGLLRHLEKEGWDRRQISLFNESNPSALNFFETNQTILERLTGAENRILSINEAIEILNLQGMPDKFLLFHTSAFGYWMLRRALGIDSPLVFIDDYLLKKLSIDRGRKNEAIWINTDDAYFIFRYLTKTAFHNDFMLSLNEFTKVVGATENGSEIVFLWKVEAPNMTVIRTKITNKVRPTARIL